MRIAFTNAGSIRWVAIMVIIARVSWLVSDYAKRCAFLFFGKRLNASKALGFTFALVALLLLHI